MRTGLFTAIEPQTVEEFLSKVKVTKHPFPPTGLVLISVPS
jgi:hypothetical protein